LGTDTESEIITSKLIGFDPVYTQDEDANTYKFYQPIQGFQNTPENINQISKKVSDTYDEQIKKVQEEYDKQVHDLYSTNGISIIPNFIKELLPDENIKILQKAKKDKLKPIQEEKQKALDFLSELGLQDNTPNSKKDEDGVDLSKATSVLNTQKTTVEKTAKLVESTEYLKSLNSTYEKDLDKTTVNSSLFSDIQKRGIDILHRDEPNLKDAYKDIYGVYISGNKNVGTYSDAVSSEQALYYGGVDLYNRIKQEVKEIDNTLQNNRNNIYFYRSVLKDNKTVQTTNGETVTPEIASQKIKELSDLNKVLSENRSQQNTLLENTKRVVEENTLNYQENLKQQDEKNEFGSLHPYATRFTESILNLGTQLIQAEALAVRTFSSDTPEKELTKKLLLDNTINKHILQTQVLDPYSGQMVSYKEQEAIEVFDDEGNFNPYVNVPALFYNTLKTGIESEILGGIMVGGKILSTALFKGVDNGLTKAIDAVLEKGFHPYEFESASLGRMAFEVGRQPIQKGLINVADYGLQTYAAAMIPTYVLYGSEMIDQELKKGLSYEDAKVIGKYRAYVEGFTERLFPNEMDFFTNTIGNGTIRNFEQLAENEVYRNLVFSAVEKKFGKELGTKLASAYFKSAPAIKEAIKVFAEESSEEIGGEIINNKVVDPIAREKNKGYISSTDLNFQNLVNTAVATTATMLPMGGTAAHQEFKNTVNGINHSQFLVGKSPSMYLQTALSDYNSGKITKEKFENLSNKINEFSAVYKDSQKLASLNPDINKYGREEKEQYEYSIFLNRSKSQALSQEIAKTTVEANRNKMLETLNSLNEDFNKLIENGLYKTESERATFKKKELDYYINEKNLEQATDKRTLSQLGSNLATNLSFETDKALQELYTTKLKLINDRLEFLRANNISSQEDLTSLKATESNKAGVVSLETKTGKQDIEIGKEYILGSTISENSQGKRLFDYPVVKVLEVNEDGTLNISSNGELISNVDPEYLKQFKFGLKSEFDNLPENNVQKIWYNNRNNILEYNLGNGRFAVGRLEIVEKDGKKSLVFKSIVQKNVDKNGNVTKTNKSFEKKITDNSLFTPKKGFNKGVITVQRSLEDNDAQHDLKQKQLSKLQTADFTSIDRQKERRFEVLKKYTESLFAKDIEKVEKKLNSVTTKFNNLTNLLKDFKEDIKINNIKNIDYEKYKKLLSKEELKQLSNLSDNDRKVKLFTILSFKAKDLFKELNELETLKNTYEKELNDIEEELEAKYTELEDVVSEFAPNESLSKQLSEYIKLLKKEKDSLKGVKESINNLIAQTKEFIKTIEDLIKPIFPNFDISSSINSYLGNSVDDTSVDKVELQKEKENQLNKISELENKSSEIDEEIKQLDKKVRELKKLQKEVAVLEVKFEEEKAQKRKIEFLKKLYDEQDEVETDTEIIPKDETKEKEWEKSSKISLDVIFNETTSPSIYEEDENGQVILANGEPVLKPGQEDVIRLNNFLNNVKNTSAYKLLVVTVHNAKQYGLEDILFTSDKFTNTGNEIDSDIKLVIVKETVDGFVFVDEKGEELKPNSQNKDNVIYTNMRTSSGVWQNGKEAFSTELKGEEKDKLLAKKQEEHIKFRQELLDRSKTEEVSLPIVEVSNGFPVKSEQNNSVLGTIIPSTEGDVLINTQVVKVATYSAPVSTVTGTTANAKVGRPILVYGNNVQPLNNRKFSDKEIQTILGLFKYFYNNSSLKKGDNNSALKYLKKVLYFRNPEYISKNTGKKQETEIGVNQIYYNATNNSWVIGKNKVEIPNVFSEDAEGLKNLSLLGTWLGEIYQNMDVQGMLEPFAEPTGFNEKGEPVFSQWETYQAYLLSPYYLYIGTTELVDRPIEEIPLSTKIIPNSETLPNVQSRHISYKQNEVVLKEGIKPEVAAALPIITPTITIESAVDKQKELEKTNTIEETKDNTYKSLENGNTYLVVNPETNTWFQLSIDKDGNILSVDSIKLQNNPENKHQLSNVIKQSILDDTDKPIFGVDKIKLYKLTPKVEETPTQITPTTQLEAPPVQSDAKTTDSSMSDGYFALGFNEETGGFEEIGEFVPNEDPDFKIANKTSYELENLEEAKKWFKERFPNIDFQIVQGLIDNKAWGQLKNYMVLLSDEAESGTIYHEAFEVVHKHFLSPRELKSLRREFRRREGSFTDHQTGKTVLYSEATDFQIKEELAEEYREFELSKGTKKWQGQYKKNSLFDKIRNFIDFILNTDNIEDVFNKISEAKYKDKNPRLRNNNLIFTAKQSDYKLASFKVGNAAYLNDVMMGMTDFIFTEVTKNKGNILDIIEATDFNSIYKTLLVNYKNFYGGDESLADAKLTKEEFFNKYKNPENNLKLKNRLQATNSQLLNNAATWVKQNKEKGQEVTPEDFYSKLYDVLKGYEFAVNNWQYLVNKNKDYLAKYSIDFVDSEDSSEDTKSRNEYGRDVAKISAKGTANSEIKLLIASLREISDISKKEKGLKLTYKINSMFTHTPVDYNKTIINLLYKFKDCNNFADMTKVINEEIDKGNYSLYELKQKLKIGTPVDKLSIQDVELRTKFIQSLNKMEIDYHRAIINDDLTTTSFNPNEKKAANIKVEEFFNALKDDKNPVNYVDNGVLKLNKELINKDISDLLKAKTWLNSIGIKFDIKLPIISEVPSKGEIKGDKEILKDAIESFQSSLLTLSAEEVFTENNNNTRKALEVIAKIYVKYSVNYAEPQHNNIDGEPVQNIVLHNYIGRLFKTINSATSLKDLYEKIKQYNPANKGNGYLSFVQSIKTTIFGGYKNLDLQFGASEGLQERNETGIAIDRLSLADRYITQMTQNFNGNWYGLTPADAKTEGMINFGWFISKDRTNQNEHLSIFKKYIASEINAVKDYNNGLIKSKVLDSKYNKSDTHKIGEQLGHFKDILGFIPVEDFKTKSTDEILKEYNTQIEEAVNNYITEEAAKLRDLYQNQGIEIPESLYVEILNKDKREGEVKEKIKGTFENPLSYVVGLEAKHNPGLSTDKELNDFYKNYVINYTFNIFEQHKLIWGDPRYWKDIAKRTKPFNSGSYLSVVEDWFDEFYNKYDNTKYLIDENGEQIPIPITENVLGFTNYDGKVRYSTYTEVEVISADINNIINTILNHTAQLNFNSDFDSLSEENRQIVLDKTKIAREAWENKSNENDAAGTSTVLGYRELLRRNSSFSQEKNELIEYDLSLMRQEASEKGKFKYPENENGELLKQYDKQVVDKGHPRFNGNTAEINVSKPIQVGLLDTGNMQPDLVKDSLFYLSWELVKDTPAEDLYLQMIKRNTTYIVPTSGHKVGVISTTPLYIDGKVNTAEAPHNIVSFSNLTIQVETEGGSKNVSQGSQLNKLGLSNLFNNDIPVDYKGENFNELSEEEKKKVSKIYVLKEKHENALNWMTEKATVDFFEKFNIKKENDKYTISEESYPYIEELLQAELKSRGLPQNLKDSVKLVDGKFEISLDLIPQGQKFESILNSVLDKSVISPKMFGFAAPQVASTLLEKHKRDFVRKVGDKWEAVKDYNKLSKEEKAKCVLSSNDLKFVDGKMEVKLPFIFKELLKNIDPKSLGKDGLTLQYLIDKGLIDKDLLKAIGFRIPTQELNSAENIIIKDFLPLSYGKCVVVPSEITTKAGSDFDIDKLNMYIYNYKQNPKTKKLEKIHPNFEDSEEATEKRYNSYVRSKVSFFNEVRKEVEEWSQEYQEIKNKILSNLNDFREELKAEKKELFGVYSTKLDEIGKLIESNEDASEAVYEEGYKIFKKLPKSIYQQFLQRNSDLDALVNSGEIEKFEKTLNFKAFAQAWVKEFNGNDLLLQYTDRNNEVKQETVDSKQATEVLNELIANYDLFLITQGWTVEKINEFQFNLNKLQENKSVFKDLKKSLYDSWVTKENKKLYEEFNKLFIKTLAETFDLSSLEEFSKLPIHLQNTKQALQNNYMDVLFEILELPENKYQLYTPNSAKELEDLAQDVNPEKPETSLTKYLSIINNTDTRHNFIVGKRGLEIAAVNQVMHSQFQIHNAPVAFDSVIPYLELYLKALNLPLNYTPNYNKEGEVIGFNFNFGGVTDYNKEVISSKISGFINGFVDIAKDPFIIKMNANLQTAGVYLTGLRMGIPLKNLVYLFNQPIVKEYTTQMVDNKSLTARVTKQNRKTSEIIESLISKYGGDSIEKEDTYTTDELLDFIKSETKSEDFNKHQINLFEQYLYLEGISQEMLVAQQGTNADRERTPFIDSAYYQDKRIKRALKTPFKGIVQSIKDKSFIGRIQKAKQYQRQAFSELFLTGTPIINSYLEKIYDGLFEQYRGKEELLEASLDVKRNLINYLLNITPVKLPSSKSGDYMTIGEMVGSLFVGNINNVGKDLIAMQEKMQKGEIDENFFLQNMLTRTPSIRKKSQSNQNQAFNIKLLRKLTDTVEFDLLSDAIRELFQDAETQKFALALIPYAIIQSGIKTSPVSFFEILPAELVKQFTLQIEKRIKNDPNLEEKLKNYIDSYKENNWSNTDVVPAIPWKTFVASNKSSVEVNNKQYRYLQIASGRLNSKSHLSFTSNLPQFTKDQISKMRANKDYSYKTTTLYKRLDIPLNKIINLPIFDKLTEENKEKYLRREFDTPINTEINPKSGVEYKKAIYYPTNKKGDGFWISEYSQTPGKPSVLYTPVDFPITPQELFEKTVTDNTQFKYLQELLDSQNNETTTLDEEGDVVKTVQTQTEETITPTTEVNNSKVEVVNNSFNNLSEYTNEEKSKILTTFASKYNISEQKALEDINKSLKADKQGTIDKLNECF
jgi:hypothetical protein